MPGTQTFDAELTCPACGRPICTKLGIAAAMLTSASRLQEVGTEIICRACGHALIVRGVTDAAGEQPSHQDADTCAGD